MCGIVGIVESGNGTIDTDRLRAAVRSIAHRGPDDEGTYIDGPVGLGHCRLSILDPSPQGHQPMGNEDRTVWIVHNGEIYNFKELRASLADPRPYRSNTDTEVILRAYEEQGEQCVRSLQGIFAFAIYDARIKRVFLVRDRFGVKPLYYAANKGGLLFGSEFKALLAAGIGAECDPLAVLDWVFTGWTDDARCLLSGIRRVPPGGLVEFDVTTGNLRETRYYTSTPSEDVYQQADVCDGDYQGEVDRTLRDAVRRQLVSDVPVGTFCSGGVDSSLITALAALEQPSITAYNVSVSDSCKDDESHYARTVAKHLGVRLATYPMTCDAFKRHVVRTIYHVEYPLSFENAVPLFLLSRLAYEEGVRVLLSGEGADELFGGYVSQYRWLAVRRLIKARGRLFGGLLNLSINSASRLLSKVTGAVPIGPRAPGFHEVLCGGLRRRSIFNEAYAASWPLGEPLDRELAAELATQLQTYLLPILHRTDRASMMASVEARVPFLDENVVAMAQRLPPSLKLRPRRLGVEGKAILKGVAARYLPRDVVYRPKMGFQVPVEYHRGALPREWLADGFVTTTFGLRETDIRGWLESSSGRGRWMFQALEIWGQLFVLGRSPLDVEAEYLAKPRAD